MIARVLIIAGSDSGGGAGIQADIKTVTLLGGHAMTAVTALTAQNTMGVSGVMPVDPDFIMQQIHAVESDIGIDAVKLGMMGGAESIRLIADWLDTLDRRIAVIFDPVMIATSGALLVDDATLTQFSRLLQRASIVTPNIPELARLTGLAVDSVATMEIAARHLADQYGIAVLAKGGHLSGDLLADVLICPDASPVTWEDKRIATRHSHGTGCTLASAIATGLAQGLNLTDSITRARRFVRAALTHASALGQGYGPMGHGQAVDIQFTS